MTTTMGLSPSGMQASAAVYNVDAIAKQPHEKHDDVVAPIDTSGGQSSKTDLSFNTMPRPQLGRHVDMRV